MDFLQFIFKNTPLTFMTASLWRDEAFSYLMAKLPIIELLSKTAQDSNPPLYYLVLKVWIFVWGNSELAMRTLSLLFFWGVLYGAYLIMRNVFHYSNKPTSIYLLLFLTSPILHYFAFEVRMYSMLSFISMVFVYAVLSNKIKLSRIALVCGLLTHYFFVFVPVSFLIALWLTNQRNEIVKTIKNWQHALIALIPWAFFVIISSPPVGQSFWITKPSLNHFLYLPAILMTGYDSATALSYNLLPISALAVWIALGYIVWSFKKHMQVRYVFLLILGLGIPFLVLTLSLVKPVYTPRYLIFSSAFLILFLSVGSTYLKMKMRVLIFILVLGIHSSFANTQIHNRTKAPLRTTYTQVLQDLQPGDQVFVVHEFDYHPALYYFEGKAPVSILKRNYETLPWFVGKVLIPTTAVADTLPVFPKRAFVILPDGSYSIQSRQ